MKSLLFKHSSTFILLSLLFVAAIGQDKTAINRYDTCISLSSGWLCGTLSDSAKYKERGLTIETDFFYILRSGSKYYLQKSVSHKQIDSTGNLLFHEHTFKEITIDSLRYLPFSEKQFEQLKTEYISPFVIEELDSGNIVHQITSNESHPCVIRLTFSLRGNSFDKEIYARSLVKSDTIRSPDCETIIGIVDNVNYGFNQNLLLVKIYQYIKSLAVKLDNKNMVVLKD